MLRRFAALAASAFLLNLNVAVVDAACSSRQDTERAASEHAGHLQHAPTKAPERDAPTKCCDAISSCGLTLSVTGELAAMSSSLDVALAIGVAIDATYTPARAPEPPPPKA